MLDPGTPLYFPSPSLTFSHSLSVLTYPELSPRLRLRRPNSCESPIPLPPDDAAVIDVGSSRGGLVTLACCCRPPLAGAVGGGIALAPSLAGPGGGRRRSTTPPPPPPPLAVSAAVVVTRASVSVSVSLPVGSGDVCLFSVVVLLLGSLALAAATSRANQLMLAHKPPQMTERMRKWMEWVKLRRAKRRSCRQPKEALVATRRAGVGPGVKIDSQRAVRKEDMVGVGGLYVVAKGGGFRVEEDGYVLVDA